MYWNDLAEGRAEARARTTILEAARLQFLESLGELDSPLSKEHVSDSWQAWARWKNVLAQIGAESVANQIKEQKQCPSLDLGLLAQEQEQEAEQQRDDPSSFDPMDPICCICRYDAHFDPKELLLADPVSVVDVLESPAKKPRLAILS